MPSFVAEAVNRLARSAAEVQPCAGLDDLFDPKDVATGYVVQAAAADSARDAGRVPIGYKVGLTSAAAQASFGASEPMYGVLYADTLVADGAFLDLGDLCAPRLEGEIVLKVATTPNAAMDDAALLATIASVHAAYEIADSRIGRPIGIGEAIADNACSGRLGWIETGVAPDSIDLPAVAMTITDGAVLAEGSGKACLGTPIASYRWLIGKLAARGIALGAGDIILTGALAAPFAMARGKAYSISLSGLGTICLNT